MKSRCKHQPSDQPIQNLVVDSNKQSPSYPLGIPATLKAYSLTPPPTVENPERHWHTDSDESEREHPGDNDSEETDLSKTQMVMVVVMVDVVTVVVMVVVL